MHLVTFQSNNPQRKAATASRVLTNASLSEGAHALGKRDRDLARILENVGEPPLWGRRPGFPTLIQIILEQQVSLASAKSLYRRLFRHMGGMTAQSVCGMGVRGMRDLGLTRQKARYCYGLAERVLDGSLDLSMVARLPDAAGRSILMSVPGLGPWSVDIYYLMALRRPDVWPEGDLALASALRDVKRMDHLPNREKQRVIAAQWSPWRSVAARLLWAHYLEARGQYSLRPADREDRGLLSLTGRNGQILKNKTQMKGTEKKKGHY